MQRLRWFLGAEPMPFPGTFESDEVYPIHFLDDIIFLRDIIVTWTMRFNDELDPEMLRDSLLKVFNTGDWRKLGGRLRKQDGKYRLYVPQEFTEERPAFIFTQEKFDVSIDEHPLAKRLPRATATSSLQPSSKEFLSLAMRPNAPTKLKEYLTKDLPQISIHVVSFTGATLVSVMWTHIVMDALGRQELMKAWSRSLKGETIQPLLSAREDILWDAIDPQKKKPQALALESKQLKGLGFFTFAIRMLWNLFTGPAIQAKTIFIPRSAINILRNQAQEDLKNTGNGKAVVSRGDVLVSWIIQMVSKSQSCARPVTCTGAVDLRTRIPNVFEEGGSYVQNLLLSTNTMLSASEARHSTLGEIALKNRQAISNQLSDDQIVAYLQTIRRDKEVKKETMMLFAEPNSIIVCVTNAAKAYFHRSVDFGPAVIRTGDDSEIRNNPPGTIIYHHPTFISIDGTLTNWASITSDREDNYWMTAFMTPKTWENIEESLRNLA